MSDDRSDKPLATDPVIRTMSTSDESHSEPNAIACSIALLVIRLRQTYDRSALSSGFAGLAAFARAIRW